SRTRVVSTPVCAAIISAATFRTEVYRSMSKGLCEKVRPFCAMAFNRLAQSAHLASMRGSFGGPQAWFRLTVAGRALSFHRHRLRQVSRLVHVATAKHADVVSEELEGDSFQD